MKKVLRTVALALALAMLAGVLASCGDASSDADAGAPSSTAAVSAGSGGDAPSDEVVELTLWDIWTSPLDTNSTTWIETVIPEYEASHSNVRLVRESTENEAYKTKFATAQASDTLPDIFFGWGPASARELANANMLLPLDEYLDDEYMSTVQPGSLDNFTFNGQIYGLTFFSWAAALYCYTDLFEANNVAIPTTYDELLTAIDAFNAAGITPIALPAGDPWTIAFFQHIMAIRYTGAENVNAMLNGEKSFNDPGIVQSAQALLDLVAAGAFDDAALATMEADATTRFRMGEFPMYYLGDWLAGSFEDAEQTQIAGSITAVNFPAVGGDYDDQVLGGSTDGFMVNAKTEHPEEAAEFVKWVTDRMAEESYAYGGTIPTRSNFSQADYSADLPVLAVEIAGYASQSTGSTLAWDTFLPEQPKARMLSMMQELVGGAITAEDFAANLAAVIEETGYAKY